MTPAFKESGEGSCRWCTKRIGLVNHHPIPVCQACWELSKANVSAASPKGNLRERLFLEFPKEARIWVKRMSTRPDPLQASVEEAGAIADLARDLTKAMSAGDPALVARLSQEMQLRLVKLAEFKLAAPALMKDFEAGES